MSPRIVGHAHELKRSRSRLTRDRRGQLGTAGSSGVIRAPARAAFLCAAPLPDPTPPSESVQRRYRPGGVVLLFHSGLAQTLLIQLAVGSTNLADERSRARV